MVANADAGGEFVVSGLPGGTYGIKYTTNAAYNVDLPDVTIGDTETVSATIPQAGVVTVYAQDVGDADPVPAVSEWGPVVMLLIVLAAGSIMFRGCKQRLVAA